MAEQRVSITMEGNGVAQVRLTRGDKLNALDPAMFDAIEDAGHQLRADKMATACLGSRKFWDEYRLQNNTHVRLPDVVDGAIAVMTISPICGETTT